MRVFPAGMYASASMQLRALTGLPLIHRVGTATAWAAAVIVSLGARPSRGDPANYIVVR
jgi:hypothetical protein